MFSILAISSIFLVKKHVFSSNNYSKNTNENVNIYEENKEDEENTNSEDSEFIQAINKENDEEIQQEVQKNDSDINITVLGEIMMGGEVTNKVSYMYANSFKKVYNETRQADYTYATLSTSITSLDKIEADIKSKYLVTNSILTALNALGVDGVSIANDHIIDYGDIILKNTISSLNKNDVNVTGTKDSVIYFEKNNKKIAIVSANAVILGTQQEYLNNNINVYDKETMKNDIAKARQNADYIIVDMHWGREYVYGVTDEMRQIAKDAIDNGADLVMGTHAFGIYPIVMYNGKPIIYSTGYFMTDMEDELAKRSYIFDITLNKEAKLTSITLEPVYIQNQSEVIPFFDVDSDKAQEVISELNEWNKQNGLNSVIEKNKIVVKF